MLNPPVLPIALPRPSSTHPRLSQVTLNLVQLQQPLTVWTILTLLPHKVELLNFHGTFLQAAAAVSRLAAVVKVATVVAEGGKLVAHSTSMCVGFALSGWAIVGQRRISLVSPVGLGCT